MTDTTAQELIQRLSMLGDQLRLQTLVQLALTRPVGRIGCYDERPWRERVQEAEAMLREANDVQQRGR